MAESPCPHCGTTARQRRADGRCVSCGKQLPEALRAAGSDVVATLVRKPMRSDAPPIYQTRRLEVGCAGFLQRQMAVSPAAARAVASLPPGFFAGLHLFLINNTADENNDAWLRLSGHGSHDPIVFFELVATRVRRWFRKSVFRVDLSAFLPPESLNDLISLIHDGTGLDDWEKERGGREAVQVWVAEIGLPVMSHAPGSRLVMR